MEQVVEVLKEISDVLQSIHEVLLDFDAAYLEEGDEEDDEDACEDEDSEA
jgi:hypothetical protein